MLNGQFCFINICKFNYGFIYTNRLAKSISASH